MDGLSNTSGDPREGRLLDGRYRLVRRLGAGGRGVVYEARHEEMGRSVAIKLLGAELDRAGQALERFRREGRAAGRLLHPNVVVVHDFCLSGEEAYLVMELCEGGSLADELSRDGKLAFDRVADVLEAVGAAVGAAHEAGIVHRDLKPANILLSRGAVKVADFGLASLSEDDPSPGLTGDHAVGTPHYMSPEQAQGRPADPRSDVYGLGVIAYEMLTGFVPFSGASVMSVLMKHLTQLPRPLHAADAAIPLPISAAVLKALEKDPARRYQTVRELVDAVAPLLRGAPRAPDARAETKPLPAITTLSVDSTGVSLAPAVVPGPIGRDGPLIVMNSRLLAALRGRGGFLFVSGEPGSGKTTLVDAFLARETGARPEILTAVGRCSEHFGSGEAYLPFLEIVSRLVNGLEEGRVAGFLRSLAPSWARLFPALLVGATLDERLEAAGATPPAQDRMPRELSDFLAALSTVRPIVLVLEDLHWADNASVDLLAYLARRIVEMRLLVVATYRRSEIEVTRHPLRQALRGLSSSGAEVAPPPFTEPEVEAFLTRELGTGVAPEVVRFVHRKTEGNPLFVVNVLRHLKALGALREDAGRMVAARSLDDLGDEVPEGITGVILSRFDRLDEEDRRLLQVASVQGERFDSGALASVLGADELDVEDRLDRLHRVHGLVEPTGELEHPDGTLSSGFRFVHAFYEDALYGSIPPKRRTAWHSALGRYLAGRHEGGHDPAPGEGATSIAAVLAVHFEKGREFPRAIAALEQAAANAVRRSPREAGPLLERAVAVADRLTGDVALRERVRLLTRLGRHQSETAEIVGDVRLYDRAEAAVSEALQADPRGPLAAEARRILALVRIERGQNERALIDLDAVLAEHASYAPAHATLAYLYKNAGLWDRCLAAQEAAGAIDPGWAHSIPRLSALIYQVRLPEAQAEADALLAERPRFGHFHYWKGIVHYYAGDLGRAREWVERGYQLDPDNFIARGVYAFILAQTGDRERAEQQLAAAEPGAAADGTFTYWIAKVRAALGQPDAAVAWIGKAAELGYWNAPWIERDRALVPLRHVPAFRNALEKVWQRHRAFAALVEARHAS